MCTYGGITTRHFYDKQDDLFAYLEEAERNYNGTFDPSMMEKLLPLAVAYGSAAENYFS